MEITHHVLEPFKLKGYVLEGTIPEIPALWERLNTTLQEQHVVAEQSFGVTLYMQEGKIRYLAGVDAELGGNLADVEEIEISGGKYISTKVYGGVEAIPAAFAALAKQPMITVRPCFCFERYVHPEGSTGYETEVWIPIE